MKQVCLHEDDYCQIELLPKSSLKFCVTEMKKIEQFSEAHKTDFGWSDMYLRTEETMETLSFFEFSLDLWTNNLTKLSFHPKVTSGYSSHVELLNNCVAWTGDNEVTIFADTDKNIIQRVWFTFDNLTAQGIQNSFTAIQQIPQYKDLIIADWNSGQIINIFDDEKLLQYLHLQDRDA